MKEQKSNNNNVLLLVAVAAIAVAVFLFTRQSGAPPTPDVEALPPGAIYYTGPKLGRGGDMGLPDGTIVKKQPAKPERPDSKSISPESKPDQKQEETKTQ
ncbi:MAG: hypothetical protein ACOYON_05595 [Fimbriimonas sp.]